MWYSCFIDKAKFSTSLLLKLNIFAVKYIGRYAAEWVVFMDVRLSYKLLDLRREHAYTQAKIAELLGCEVSLVSEWEQGKSAPDSSMMKKLCEVYKISVDELMFKDEVPTTQQQASYTTPPPKQESYSYSTNNKDEEYAKRAREYEERAREREERAREREERAREKQERAREKEQHAREKREKPVFSSPEARNTYEQLKKLRASYPIIVVILFFLIGSMFDIWEYTWLMFLSIPLFYTLTSAYGHGEFSKQEVISRFLSRSYPLLVTVAFLSIGMMFDIWHPTWMLYLTIPLFYIYRR